MKIPTTPEEAQELKKKLAANDEAEDWVTSIFPTVGIGMPKETSVNSLLKEIGTVRIPPK
jgi:hypothetical protein